MGTRKPPRQWESKQMFQCLGLKQGVLSAINTRLRNLWVSSREPRAPVNVYLKFCLFVHLYICLRRRSTAFIRLSSRSVTTTTKVKIPWASKAKYAPAVFKSHPVCDPPATEVVTIPTPFSPPTQSSNRGRPRVPGTCIFIQQSFGEPSTGV